jgi:alpha-mannosidase
MFSGNTPDTDRAIDRVRRALDRMAPLARSDRRLLTNGCDHLPPQQGLTEVMAAVRQANPGSHFEIGSLTTFLDGLRPAGPGLSVYAGELRGARTEHLLPGVLSTRMPIKQANERCECLVAAVLEPLASYLHFVCGAPYPGHAIDVLWKQLLANHPHDSICGCGTDLVHREMMTRFHGIVEVAEEYIATGLERLFPRTGSDGAHLAVFNPLPFPRRAIVEQTVVLSADIEVARIELVDRAGMPLPFTVVRADRVKRFWGPEWSRIIDAEAQREALELYEREHPGWFEVSGDRHDLFVTVQFDVTLPAIGVGVVSLRHRSPDRAPTQLPHRLAADETTIENEFIRVTMSPDGRLAIDDKRNDARYEGLNRLVDDEDAGDEYDYAHAEEPLSVSAVGLHGRVAIVEDTGFRATLETAFVWNLPEALTRDRTRRTEERIGCRVRIRASVTRGSPVVEIETAFDNDARDHRLRALFPTGLRATEIVSDGAFHLDHRPVDVAERPDWVQQPADAYPQREFSLVENGTRGVAVLNRGLPEVAPFRASDETVGIALTLLRCVGWLSRDDLSSRDRAVGPILPTPDAQCQGPHRFHYGVVPLCEPHRAADLKRLSAAYRVRPVAVQVQSAHGIAPDGGLFEIRPTGTHPAAAVSAVKRHADRDTLVVRLYDWSGQPSTQQLAFAQDLAGAWRTNLLEEREDELPVQSRRAIALDMTSFEVVTLEVAFA